MKETNVHKAIRASFERAYWRTSEFGPPELAVLVHISSSPNLDLMRLGGAEEFYIPARNFFAGFPISRGEA